MSIFNTDYDEFVGTVKSVTFGILSPERIKGMSVCEIYNHITNMKSPEGTLMDLRLGPTDRGLICPTCKYTYTECPGHFGHLVLAKPMIQYPFFSTIIKILGFYCSRCSAFLLNVKGDPQMEREIKLRQGKGRFTYVESIFSKSHAIVSKCWNCGAVSLKYREDRDGILRITGSLGKKDDENKSTIIMNPEMILNIFKNITDEDVEWIGLNPKYSRPEWMIWTIMPIPPPAMRPSVKDTGGRVSCDDLTRKLNDIIKYNNQLRIKLNDKETKKSYIDDCWQLVQYHVATYCDNEISNLPHAQQRSGRPLKTIRQRIKAKEGRIRGNLMGKRVNGSARSVITPDPYLSMDQLGVPKKIAMNLTYPELVTVKNIAYMTQLVRNGPNKFPGAKGMIRRGDGHRINFKPREDLNDIALQPGDIVYRHLMDNDWVLFNRQPTLHRMGMMAHRVKVLDYNTFRFSPNVCAPYNGDFDGDRTL